MMLKIRSCLQIKALIWLVALGYTNGQGFRQIHAVDDDPTSTTLLASSTQSIPSSSFSNSLPALPRLPSYDNSSSVSSSWTQSSRSSSTTTYSIPNDLPTLPRHTATAPSTPAVASDTAPTPFPRPVSSSSLPIDSTQSSSVISNASNNPNDLPLLDPTDQRNVSRNWPSSINPDRTLSAVLITSKSDSTSAPYNSDKASSSRSSNGNSWSNDMGSSADANHLARQSNSEWILSQSPKNDSMPIRVSTIFSTISLTTTIRLSRVNTSSPSSNNLRTYPTSSFAIGPQPGTTFTNPRYPVRTSSAEKTGVQITGTWANWANWTRPSPVSQTEMINGTNAPLFAQRSGDDLAWAQSPACSSALQVAEAQRKANISTEEISTRTLVLLPGSTNISGNTTYVGPISTVLTASSQALVSINDHCCGGCDVRFPTVSVYYWPPSNGTTNTWCTPYQTVSISQVSKWDYADELRSKMAARTASSLPSKTTNKPIESVTFIPSRTAIGPFEPIIQIEKRTQIPLANDNPIQPVNQNCGRPLASSDNDDGRNQMIITTPPSLPTIRPRQHPRDLRMRFRELQPRQWLSILNNATNQDTYRAINGTSVTNNSTSGNDTVPAGGVRYAIGPRGHTFLSPSVYVEFHTVIAINSCGLVGDMYTSQILAFAPEELSTIEPVERETRPFNFDDLPCPRTDWKAPNMYQGHTKALADLAAHYRPTVFGPENHLRQLDPAWSSCTVEQIGNGLDPPRPLTAAGIIMAPTNLPPLKPSHTGIGGIFAPGALQSADRLAASPTAAHSDDNGGIDFMNQPARQSTAGAPGNSPHAEPNNDGVKWKSSVAALVGISNPSAALLANNPDRSSVKQYLKDDRVQQAGALPLKAQSAVASIPSPTKEQGPLEQAFGKQQNKQYIDSESKGALQPVPASEHAQQTSPKSIAEAAVAENSAAPAAEQGQILESHPLSSGRLSLVPTILSGPPSANFVDNPALQQQAVQPDPRPVDGGGQVPAASGGSPSVGSTADPAPQQQAVKPDPVAAGGLTLTPIAQPGQNDPSPTIPSNNGVGSSSLSVSNSQDPPEVPPSKGQDPQQPPMNPSLLSAGGLTFTPVAPGDSRPPQPSAQIINEAAYTLVANDPPGGAGSQKPADLGASPADLPNNLDSSSEQDNGNPAAAPVVQNGVTYAPVITDPPATSTLGVVAGQPINGNADRAVVQGQTLTPNAAPITISGTPVALSNQNLIIGTQTKQLPPANVDASPPTTFTNVGGQPIVNSPDGVRVGDRVLQEGNPAVTVAGTPVSLASDNNLVIGSSTIPIPTSATSNPSAFAIYGQTVSSNGPPITVQGTPVSLGPDGLVVGSSTIPLTSSTPRVFSLSGTVITENGDSITVSGTAVSLGPKGIVVGSKTIVIPTSSALTVGDEIITPAATGFSITGLATSITPGGIGAVISGTTVSLNSDSELVVGTSTIAMVVNTASHPKLEVGGQDLTALPGENGGLAVGGNTITMGGPGVSAGGHGYSLNKGGSLVVDGTSTLPLAIGKGDGTLTALGQTFVPLGSTAVSVGGTTIPVGSEATVNGTTVSLATDGLVVEGSKAAYATPAGNVETGIITATAPSGGLPTDTESAPSTAPRTLEPTGGKKNGAARLGGFDWVGLTWAVAMLYLVLAY